MTTGNVRTFTAVALLFACVRAASAGNVSLDLGHVEVEGIVLEDVHAAWAPSRGAAGRAVVRAARIRGLEATGPLRGLTIECRELDVTGDALSCARGRLAGRLGSLGQQDTRFTARRAADGALELRIADLAIGGGSGPVMLRVAGEDWRVDVPGATVDLGAFAAAAAPWLELPAGFSVAGMARGSARAAGRGEALQSARVEAALESLAFSDADGALAGEGLGGNLVVELSARGEPRFDAMARVTLSAGQAYADPVFLDFGAHAADAELTGTLDTDRMRLEAGDFTLDHAGALRAAGRATLDLAGDGLLVDGLVRVESLDLGHALPVYAQPFLVATAFRDVVGKGRLRGEVEISGGLPERAALELDGVAFESATASVALEGLRGRLNWYDDALRSALAGRIDDRLFQSELSWDAGRLWGLELGAARLPFATAGRHFRLTEPVVLPVFDGGLAIDTLRVRHAGLPEMYVRFDAAIEPIDVARLSRAFGWPEFQGSLAGSIPGLQLRQGEITLDGNLEASVFDGGVQVRELRLRDPLGKFPRLFASIAIEDLDLALVTRTFEFGMITGRMSGYIADLETFGWMPEAFDAFLFTPVADDSRHRISQRAVTSLSSIGGGSGGGVAAALQGGFLRFFDDFGYDRLGLSCRLANDVCIMGGVEPAASGSYYIVKGRGLPRIDVIGSQTRVAWTTLVRQLAAVTESEIVVR